MLRLVVGVVLAGVSVATRAQFPPAELTNLQVFPEDIQVRELVDKMRSIAVGLGVRCTHCHVGEEGAPLSTLDFASDEKEEKHIARLMLRMVAEINGEFLDGLPRRVDPVIEVQCETCHRGQPHPRMIDDVLEIESSIHGPEKAAEAYRRLREMYYGSASFDFSQTALHRYTQELLRQGRRDAALVFAALNAEYHPTEPQVHFLLGEVCLAMDDPAGASAHYQRALELQPSFAPAKRRLDALNRVAR